MNMHRNNGRQLKVRLGEWDASTTAEPVPPQEYIVSRIFIHQSYTASNLKNDIAILRLVSPVTLGTVSRLADNFFTYSYNFHTYIFKFQDAYNHLRMYSEYTGQCEYQVHIKRF